MEIKKGQLIQGVKITWTGIIKTATNRNQRGIKFLCGCGKTWETLLAVATKAVNGNAKLHCRDCQEAAKNKDHVKPSSEDEPSVNATYKSGLAPQVVRLFQRQTETVRTAVEADIRRRLRLQIEYGTPKEDINRLFIEAIELARKGRLEEAERPPYMAERRYGQYTSPRDFYFR